MEFVCRYTETEIQNIVGLAVESVHVHALLETKCK